MADASTAGSANLSTSGTSATVTLPAADYSNMVVGTKIYANSLSRFIVELLGSNQVKVDSAVNWSTGYSY